MLGFAHTFDNPSYPKCLGAALLGAWSAHGKRDYALRDEYPDQAAECGDADTVARLMAQVEMFLDERRYHDALNVIRQLPEKHSEALQPSIKAEIEMAARYWKQKGLRMITAVLIGYGMVVLLAAIPSSIRPCKSKV